MIDDCREEHIQYALRQIEVCLAVGWRDMARSWFETAKVLIGERSPHQQRLMELSRGLALQ